MYRYSNGQISLADFKQPVTTNLKECNRWGKKAQIISLSKALRCGCPMACGLGVLFRRYIQIANK